MSDSDLIKLYSQRILALAADIPHLGHLPAPSGRSKKRAPLCGSTISVDLVVTDGRVSDFAQEVKACALGQAAASVVGANVIGATREQIETARDQLKAMLKDNGPAPDAPFGGLEVLMAAREYPNRHGSILLSLEATLEAFDAAQAAA
ncbi:iron-sulfur cluster assembly scaffold protein [Actibacterium sp. XHP0104]|uniref:iron-sulfur cluster assembly scaffold protein n=1 Tax=Actibacterium sp. XHP0104 TaxID=2984335 RepID=UPI0021E8A0FD|nr:iron-sulfur cluster assembly scaffold protein [Actibacterium sp. XHP0104]MCV2881121.1 iron-sulfur cluster assembly scaffold protein [Actibacterium sp. XHP0104]